MHPKLTCSAEGSQALTLWCFLWGFFSLCQKYLYMGSNGGSGALERVGTMSLDGPMTFFVDLPRASRWGFLFERPYFAVRLQHRTPNTAATSFHRPVQLYCQCWHGLFLFFLRFFCMRWDPPAVDFDIFVVDSKRSTTVRCGSFGQGPCVSYGGVDTFWALSQVAAYSTSRW